MIFKQYLKLFLRNLKVVVINFVIFSVCILIFTKNNELTSFEKVKLNIVVNDLDKSEYSKALINYLSKDNNVTEQTLDENEARKKVFERQINAYINIKENFKENLQNNISPVTVLGSETTPRFIFMKIDLNKMLSFMETAIKTNTPISEVETSLDKEIKVNIADNKNYVEEQIKEKNTYIYSITSYIVFIIVATIISNIGLNFKNKDVVRRVSTAPVNEAKITTQRFFSQIIVSVVIVSAFIIILYLQNGNKIFNENIALIFSAMCVYSFTAIAVAEFFMSFTDNTKTINTLISISSLIMGFSSGAFVPIELIPKSISNFSKFFPLYYFIDFVKNIATDKFIYFILIQTLFILLFLLLSIYIRKTKLKSER